MTPRSRMAALAQAMWDTRAVLAVLSFCACGTWGFEALWLFFDILGDGSRIGTRCYGFAYVELNWGCALLRWLMFGR